MSKPLHLLFQSADQSLWLVSLNGGAGRQLTASLSPADDVVTWSLSPDQQWLAYIQVKSWRKGTFADRRTVWLLNVWTGEKRALLEVSKNNLFW